MARIYFPVIADHDGWDNNLTAYENAQWYFVIESDGKIKRLSEFSCISSYPSDYIKEVGGYMIPKCEPFINEYKPY